MNKANLLIIGIITLLVLISACTPSNIPEQNFEEKREVLISQLFANIEEAKLEGNYRCCIEPACTMCYLGNWIWDNGTCACDDMIAKGEFDKVCPQCQKGLEEGTCSSVAEPSDDGTCEVTFET